MPITPQFDLRQTEQTIIVDIYVPHVRVSSETVQVVLTDGGTVLHFASPPYLLLLNFSPHKFHDEVTESNAESCASYDPSVKNGRIRLELKKAERKLWENLDLIGKWTSSQTQQQGTSRWLRQVRSGYDDASKTNGDNLDEEGHGSDARASERNGAKREKCGYGFVRMFHGMFADLSRDGLANEMLEMPWEEFSTSLFADTSGEEGDKEEAMRKHRRATRRDVEQGKFHEERYLQDLDIHDDYIYQCALTMKPHWIIIEQSEGGLSLLEHSTEQVQSLSKQLATMSVSSEVEPSVMKTNCNDKQPFVFTTEERLLLAEIPYPLLQREYSFVQQRAVQLGLLDLLFSYVYDHLTTSGEATVESAWTVSILSASLSWLDDWQKDDDVETEAGEEEKYDEIVDVVTSSIRRSLIYPYIRNFDFSLTCWQHVSRILRQGTRCVIRSLLQIRCILDHSDLYYLGNKLFVDPYLAWLQQQNHDVNHLLLVALAAEVDQVLQERDRMKVNLDLNLNKLEESAVVSSDEESVHEQNDSTENSGLISGSNDDSNEDEKTDDDNVSSSGFESSSSSEEDNSDKDEIGNTQTLQPLQKLEDGVLPCSSSALMDSNLTSTTKESILQISTIDASPPALRQSKGPLIEEL